MSFMFEITLPGTKYNYGTRRYFQQVYSKRISFLSVGKNINLPKDPFVQISYSL